MKQTFFYLTILLLGCTVHSQTVLEFSYDSSGNQILRNDKTNSPVSRAIQSDSLSNLNSLSGLSKETIENRFKVYPNPTSGEAILSWDELFTEQIISVELTNLVTNRKTPIKQIRGNSISVDLSGKITGLYIVTFYLKNTIVDNVQKKIIKL